MQPLRIFFLLYLLQILSVKSISAQCSIDEVSLDKKTERATFIIEGKIIEKKSFFNKQHNFIYTCNKLQVYKYFKNKPDSKIIYIITEGGMVNNKLLSVSPSVKLDTGVVGLFMLLNSQIQFPDDSSSQTYSLYSGVQGFIKYNLKDKTASTPFKTYTNIATELYKTLTDKLGKSFNSVTPFDINNISTPTFNLRANTAVISSFSPTVTSAGTYSVLTINGSGFGSAQGNSTVNFKNTNNGGQTYIQPFPTQYLAWSNTQIKVQVPSNAGTGQIQVDIGTPVTSRDTLRIRFSELNASNDNNSEAETKIVGLNYENGITWRMNVNLNADTAAKASFIRAFSTWKCTTFINWSLGANTLIDSAVNDSVNVITFGNVNNSTEGTLGVCYSYWGQCASSDWILEEADILINPNVSWEFGPSFPSNSTFDFQSVMLHELGHGHQLGHVTDETNLMNYSIARGNVRRTLNASNIDAANDILNRSTAQNYCNYPIFELITASNCSDLYIVNEDSNFLIFPNPSNGYFNLAIPSTKQNLNIYVYTSLGDVLTTITTNQSSNYVSFDLSEYPNGIYFLRIDNGEQTTFRKLLLVKK
jgi:hypothetical protein